MLPSAIYKWSFTVASISALDRVILRNSATEKGSKRGLGVWPRPLDAGCAVHAAQLQLPALVDHGRSWL